MGKLLLIIFFVFNTLLTPSTYTHPIKLTSSEIKYDAKAKSVRVECKVFIDDFAPAISATLLTIINQSDLRKEDLTKIENYFYDKYKIMINGKPLPWKIKSYYVDNNVLTLVFVNNNINIQEGDDLKIENALLFESFGDIQSNWMTIRFPPYIRNYNFESKMENPIYSHIF